MLISDEELKKVGLLTLEEVKSVIEEAAQFEKENPDVPCAYTLKNTELINALSRRKIAQYAFQAGKAEGIKTVVELLNREMSLLQNGLGSTRHWLYNLDYDVWQSFLKEHELISEGENVGPHLLRHDL